MIIFDIMTTSAGKTRQTRRKNEIIEFQRQTKGTSRRNFNTLLH